MNVHEPAHDDWLTPLWLFEVFDFHIPKSCMFVSSKTVIFHNGHVNVTVNGCLFCTVCVLWFNPPLAQRSNAFSQGGVELAGDAHLLQRLHPTIQMAFPCKTNKSAIRPEKSPFIEKGGQYMTRGPIRPSWASFQDPRCVGWEDSSGEWW